jgi:hypothetical protein
MNLVGNIAPLVGALLFCAIAYFSVRRAHARAAKPERESGAAAE